LTLSIIWFTLTDTKELGVELRRMAPDRQGHIVEMMKSKKVFWAKHLGFVPSFLVIFVCLCFFFLLCVGFCHLAFSLRVQTISLHWTTLSNIIVSISCDSDPYRQIDCIIILYILILVCFVNSLLLHILFIIPGACEVHQILLCMSLSLLLSVLLARLDRRIVILVL